MEILDFIIVGAGAAGCFAGSVLALEAPHLQGLIVEKTRQPLAKVRLSGGGRCNVTHHCFEIDRLVAHYPRGSSFLHSAFYRFQPRDMVEWLQQQGVELIVEPDGRMFPKSERSATIVDTLLQILQSHSLPIEVEEEVISLTPRAEWIEVKTRKGQILAARRVLLTTGGVGKHSSFLAELGHDVVLPVPSLFTFSLEKSWLTQFPGSVFPQAKLSLVGTSWSQVGPVLVTHEGISGPAVLKLSAFAARFLWEVQYRASLSLSVVGGLSEEVVFQMLGEKKKNHPGQAMDASTCFSLSKNLWKGLVAQVGLENQLWSSLSHEKLRSLARLLCGISLEMVGKSLHKEEFVTAGGIRLGEIYPKTMESKKVPCLHFAGEVLDIDGVTGGFNFQNAWTTGWIAAQAIRQALL